MNCKESVCDSHDVQVTLRCESRRHNSFTSLVGVFYVIALNITFVMSEFTIRMEQDGIGRDGTEQ